ncbi:MAG: hypothetical protein JF592_11170 [Microbacterium sp.]|uniref:hypothetical protein n=1 Tax=Microbacterium sp. TaxID=51671 RepID=UPI001DD756FA|nr:hypothetical protein [Microbacterium sp.]MBW8763130.1 hypothetical protein [Microbacterium sp.]
MSWWKTSFVAVAAAGATVVLSALGVELPFAIGWALAGGAVALLPQLALPVEPGADAPHVPADRERRATEISRMAWALNARTGLAGERVTRRVRSILRHRLQRMGIDPDDPADRARRDAVLGGDVWDRLAGQNTSIAAVERALDAIDRLSPTKEKK